MEQLDVDERYLLFYYCLQCLFTFTHNSTSVAYLSSLVWCICSCRLTLLYSLPFVVVCTKIKITHSSDSDL